MAEYIIENEAQQVLNAVGENINLNFNGSEISVEDEYDEEIEMELLNKDVNAQAINIDEKAQPLNDEEIEIAMQNIEELYPLKGTTLDRLFPYLCCFLRCCRSKPSHLTDQRNVFLGQHSELESSNPELAESFKDDDVRLNKKIKSASKKFPNFQGKPYEGTDFIEDSIAKFNHDEQAKAKTGEKQQDPLALYGFGVTAYFKLLSSLIFVFFILSLKASIIMYIYRGYSSETDLDTVSSMGRLVYHNSMSRMPLAQTFCVQQFYGTGQNNTVSCDSGTIKTPFEDVEYGFIRSGGKVRLDDGVESPVYNDYCGLQSDVKPAEQNCNKYINHQKFEDFYIKECLDKYSCNVNVTDIMNLPSPATDRSNECTANGYFYMQMECQLTAGELKSNREVGIIIVFIGIIMSVLYFMVLGYLEKVSKVDYKIWDINTCTVADYSIELLLPNRIWQEYMHQRKNNQETRPFDQFILETFEQFVDGLPQRLDHFEGNVKIAALSFGYYDGGLINLLTKRGLWIGQDKLKNVDKVHQQMTKLVNTRKEEISRPVSCFVTFNCQEGHDRCEYFLFEKDHNGKKNLNFKQTEFMNEKARVKHVAEPSDVIWENLHHSFYHRQKKSIMVFIVITIFIVGCFILFTFLKTNSGQAKLKYPNRIDCKKLQGEMTKKQLRSFAQIDQEPTQQMHGAGYYQCYCKQYSKKTALADSSDENLCDAYQGDFSSGIFLSSMVTFLVAFTNIIIRNLNMFLIGKIGYHTHSERCTAIMTSVFITSFINTGILLLLTNANFKFTFLSFLSLRGQFADFTVSWFTNIGGSIAQTMLIQAFMPYIEITIALSIKKLLQGLDSGFPCCPRGADKPKTKCNTNQKYMNLYSGPEYMMHFRYSSIMVQVYVAFMYALFMPIIVPIATIGIFNMYVVERLALSYYYRQPPMYDEKLNSRAIDFLQGAPILMFLTSYWAFGNQQIFNNVAPIVNDHANNVQDPQHQAFQFHSINATQLIMLVLIYLILDTFFYKYRVQLFRRMGLLHECPGVLRADINEELPNFWEALSGVEQKIWYATELYNRAKGISQKLTDDSLESLRTAKSSSNKKTIKSNCNYDILFNLSYQQRFQYQPLDERNEPADNIYSDVITSVLNINEEMTQPNLEVKRTKRMTNDKGEYNFNQMGMRKRTLPKKPKRKTVSSMKKMRTMK